MDKYDDLLKHLLKNKQKDAKVVSDCITEELFAAYLDNLLGNHEKVKIEEHLASCQDCRKKSIILYKIRTELAIEPLTIPPVEVTKRAKQLFESRPTQKLIEVVISFAKDSMKIIKDSAEMFKPLSLIEVEARTKAETLHLCATPSAADTVKPEKDDLRNIIHLCKQLNRIKIDIIIERIDDRFCDIEIKAIDAESCAPVDNIRVTLVSGDRELASFLTKSGITAFRNLQFGSYTLTFIDKGKVVGDILLRLEAE